MVLALPQDRYLVSVGASVGRPQGGRGPQWQFQGSGIDENDDALRWFSEDCPRIGSSWNIVVVNSATAASPRRVPRRRIAWHQVFVRQIEQEEARLRLLEDRLRALMVNAVVGERTWTTKPPAIAVRVRVNGRDFGNVSIERPGVLSITVYAKLRDKQQGAALSIHGGTQLGPQTWRRYDWSRVNQRLEVGDKVSLEFVEPRRLVSNSVRNIERDVWMRANIAAEIAEIRGRLRSNYYAEQEANMREYSLSRPKPHRYPRPV